MVLVEWLDLMTLGIFSKQNYSVLLFCDSKWTAESDNVKLKDHCRVVLFLYIFMGFILGCFWMKISVCLWSDPTRQIGKHMAWKYCTEN